MKTIFLTLIISFILLSCATYEDREHIIKKAYAFEATQEEAVIYLIRDFQASETNPIKLRFDMMQLVDTESRNKLSDAMDSLDGDSTKGAGIPYDFFYIDKKSFARIEMPPGRYIMHTYFFLASNSEIIPSKKIKDFKAGNVYILKINPENDGSWSSTIYHLEDISIEDAKRIIKDNDLPLLKFNAIYKG